MPPRLALSKDFRRKGFGTGKGEATAIAGDEDPLLGVDPNDEQALCGVAMNPTAA